jgi:hypothetical protein
MSASRRLFIASAILSASASICAAQASTPAWGTTTESSDVISAWDMQTFDYGTAWQGDVNNQYRYLTSAGALYGGLHVPNGAIIDYMELDACDNSATFQVAAGIQRSIPGETDLLASVSTTGPAADGCSRWRADLSTPEIVDTQTYDYSVYAINTGFDGSTTVGGVRVYYHLQVSPAPGTATFNDVPSNHPFFQYVEALASSGITAGCGNGNFCPDAPLTRGQMAVFLSKALGLNWPTASSPGAHQ